MTQQHGRRHEHDLNNSLNQVTTDDVWCTTSGYSGNSSSDNCDLVVSLSPQYATTKQQTQFNLECKKITSGKSGNRSILFSGSSGGETGVDELYRLIESTPNWGQPVVTVKFSRRKLVVMDARGLHAAVSPNEFVPSERVEMLEPRATDSGSISVVKPELDYWESSSAAPRDSVVLAQALGLPLQQEYEP